MRKNRTKKTASKFLHEKKELLKLCIGFNGNDSMDEDSMLVIINSTSQLQIISNGSVFDEQFTYKNHCTNEI